MNVRQLRTSTLWFGASLACAACLSSSPPAAPVRYFDPTPTTETRERAGAGLRLRVDAAPYLGREFALRVGVREYAFDPDHQWIAPPADLVAAALQSGIGFDPSGHDVVVYVERFELDLSGTPRAHLQLLVRSPLARIPTKLIAASAPAADRSPPALAAAMATALSDATAGLRAMCEQQ